MKFIEMIIDKLRINVLIVALLVTWLIMDFGDKLIGLLAGIEGITPAAIIGVISGLIGVGIGGLIAAMIRMFESPQVPADVHERMIKSFISEE